MRRGRAGLAVGVAFGVAACTMPPLETATPSPSPTSAGSPSATPGASAAGTTPALASPSPSFDPSAIPDFSGGEIVTTTFSGLRVRGLPGTSAPVITGLLGADAELEVVMGPMLVDDLGWYLVNDLDPDEPSFDEGWVAAGFEPEANLRSTGRVRDGSLVVAELAHTGDAEFGPIDVPDERHVIRWVAVDPERVGCQFAVQLAAGGAEPVPAISSPIGDELVPGILQSTFFVAQPSLRGQLFLTVRSDCAWALAVLREPDPEPIPSP